MNSIEYFIILLACVRENWYLGLEHGKLEYLSVFFKTFLELGFVLVRLQDLKTTESI
jgi:hypothetical protein